MGEIKQVSVNVDGFGEVTFLNVNIGPLTDLNQLFEDIKEARRRLYGRPKDGKRSYSPVHVFIEDQLNDGRDDLDTITDLWILKNKERWPMGREGIFRDEYRTVRNTVSKHLKRIKRRQQHPRLSPHTTDGQHIRTKLK